jgi:hypothetical protein
MDATPDFDHYGMGTPNTDTYRTENRPMHSRLHISRLPNEDLTNLSISGKSKIRGTKIHLETNQIFLKSQDKIIIQKPDI